MPALRNGGAAPRRRGPQHIQHHGIKTDGVLEVAATLSCVSTSAGRRAVAKPVASAPFPGSQRSSGRSGAHFGRAAVTQKLARKTAAGQKIAGGRLSEPCAWPAFIQSAAKAEKEALAAVISLYEDELKPFGRILRKRVAERILEGQGKEANIANLDALPEVDTKQVRAVCEACEVLQVEEEDGGDWSAVFLDRPETFVDVYSPADCYPEQFWSGLQDYCESRAGQDMSLPGGRYACAQALKALQLPLLANFSLGRICHVVQLAISQKKILGYMNGAVVPYKRSQSMMKDQCAMYGQPNTSNNNGHSNMSTLPIASLEVTRKHLCEILDKGNGEVPLSNVKRLFRSRFQLELSETSFGYSKLSELLQDSNFSDICKVELRGHGYTVIQLDNKSNDMASPSLSDSFQASVREKPAKALGFQASVLEDSQRRVALCADEPLSFDNIDALAEGTSIVPSPPRFAVTGAATSRSWCRSPSKDTHDCLIACSVQHTFLQYNVPQTPLPGPKRRSHSLPKDMGRTEWPEIVSAVHKRAPASASELLAKPSDDGGSTTDRSCSERKRADTGSSTGISSNHSLRGDRAGLEDPQENDSATRCASFLPNEPLGFGDSEVFWGRTPGTTPLPSPAPRAPIPTTTSGYGANLSTAFASFGQSSFYAEDGPGMLAPVGGEPAAHRIAFCPDEPLRFDEEPSSLPALSRATMTPSPLFGAPAATPSPLYNYTDATQCIRESSYSSPPQATLPSGLAIHPSSALGFTGAFTTPLPAQAAQAGSFYSTSHVPRQNIYPGCVIRLGEHI